MDKFIYVSVDEPVLLFLKLLRIYDCFIICAVMLVIIGCFIVVFT